jgi:hypothetical protein
MNCPARSASAADITLQKTESDTESVTTDEGLREATTQRPMCVTLCPIAPHHLAAGIPPGPPKQLVLRQRRPALDRHTIEQAQRPLEAVRVRPRSACEGRRIDQVWTRLDHLVHSDATDQ